MLSRLCARLVTGPGAFLIGGLLDAVTLALAILRARAARQSARKRQGGALRSGGL